MQTIENVVISNNFYNTSKRITSRQNVRFLCQESKVDFIDVINKKEIENDKIQKSTCNEINNEINKDIIINNIDNFKNESQLNLFNRNYEEDNSTFINECTSRTDHDN